MSALNVTVVCPKCAAPDPELLGQVRSNVDWYKCRKCRHVWPSRQSGAGDQPGNGGPTTCSKCGKKAARVIGRSGTMVYVQCGECGHTSGRTDDAPS